MQRGMIAVLAVLFFLALTPTGRCGTFVLKSEAEQTRLMLELRAQQFLNRATFGATDAEITTLADSMATLGVKEACLQWIDTQMAITPTLHVPTIRSFLATDLITNNADTTQNLTRYRYYAWWHNAIAAPDQLKQRLAWALLQICVIGEGGNDFSFVEPTVGSPDPFWFGVSSYYDVLLSRCDDRYLDVLTDITFHPIMGVWLSSVRNPKATATTSPDENYAREIMQLFMIGLNELNIDGTYKLDANNQVIPTYGNEDIEELARVMTGFNYAGASTTNINSGNRNYNNTMLMVPTSHDNGAKQLLDYQKLDGSQETGTLAASTDGVQDIKNGVKLIYGHPNVAPFISRLLIQRLVRSNPSKAYISRVATVFNGSGDSTKGDMKAVVKAILTDDEAWESIQMTPLQSPWRLDVTSGGTEQARLVEPVVQYASFVRRFGKTNSTTGNRFFLPATPGTWNQAPFRSPSVFNFYSPLHQPAGGLATAIPSNNIPNGDLAAPEFQIITAVVANAWQNRSRTDVVAESYAHTSGTAANTSYRIDFDFSKEKFSAGNVSLLIERLDKVLCNGVMTDDFRNRLNRSITRYVPQTTANPSSGNPTVSRDRDRVRGAMITVMNSPFYLIRY